MKGIILAGGLGTRLFPMTQVVCKQLLPVYDKPLIYYPLSTLMLADIREILIISTADDIPHFQRLFGDGSHLGLSLTYAVQETPRGLADAFILGRDFIGNDSVALILGDNIFWGHGFAHLLETVRTCDTGANVFACAVSDPARYGVIGFDSTGKPTTIDEKPEVPQSRYAVAGLYFYDNTVCAIAETIQPSARGEIEITDINREYLHREELSVHILGDGFAWLDAGTPESMMEASAFVKSIEDRTGVKIACIEEIAWRKGFISREHCIDLGMRLGKSLYGQYLLRVTAEDMKITSGENSHACTE